MGKIKEEKPYTGSLMTVTDRQIRQANGSVRKGWMRNAPCPCGSGNRFKLCCWDDIAVKSPTKGGQKNG